jgi:hypothetical protein
VIEYQKEGKKREKKKEEKKKPTDLNTQPAQYFIHQLLCWVQ